MSATLEAQLRLDIAQLQQQLAKARGEVSKFRESAVKESGGLGKSMFGGLSDLKSLLPAMGSAALVTGFKAALTIMDDTADAAMRLGETADDVQRVGYASQLLASADILTVGKNFEKLEKALGEVDNKNAAEALEHLGLTVDKLSLMPLKDKIIAMSSAWMDAKNSGTAYNDLLDLLGKTGAEMLPMLEAGPAEIQRQYDAAVTLAEADVMRMAMLNDQIDGWMQNSKARSAGFIAEFIKDARILGTVFGGNEAATKLAGEFASEDTAAKDRAKKLVEGRKERAKARQDAIDKAKIDKAAADAAKVQTSLERERVKIEEARERLGERQFKHLLEQLSPADAMSAVQKRIAEEMERQNRVRDQGPRSERDQIADQERLMDLQEQLTAQRKRGAEAGEKSAAKRSSLDETRAELAILREQAAGHQRKAQSMQEQLDIAREAKAIAEQTGVTDAEALKMAQESVRLKKQISEEADYAAKHGGRHQIKGYSTERQGGAEEARKRLEDRLQESEDKAKESHKRSFGGLDEYDALQRRGPMVPDTPNLDKMRAKQGVPMPMPGAGADKAPLADQAAKNAKAQESRPQETSNQSAQQILQKMDQIIALCS